jgi:HlyD family secretion protein
MGATVPFPQRRSLGGAKVRSRRWRRWGFMLLVLAAIIGGIWWWRSSRQTTGPTFTTATVTQGSIAVSVSGSGAVAAARTIDVPVQQGGTVTSVDVKVGDQVTAGQQLAQIDTTDLQLALQQAQANLKSAQAQAQQTQNGTATEADIASATAQLNSARAQLQQTRTGSATAADIQNAQAQLTAAQARLDALKNPDQATLSAAQLQLSQAQTNLQNQRDSLSQAKTSAYNQMQQAVNSLTQAQSKYAIAQQNWQHVQDENTDPTNPTITNAQGKKVANKLNDAQRQQYYDAFVQAEAALHTAETAVQQAQLNYDAARQNEATQIPLLEQQVANAQAQLDAVKNPTNSDLVQAQAAVTQAQANLTKLKQGGTAAEIAQAQAAVTQAQANLDKLTAPPTDADLASADASVMQAQVAVNTAQANLDAATIKAPFAGVVAAVSIVPGSTASSGAAAVTLVDNSTYHVDVNLSETDAARVQVGQPVTLTFDALPATVITGTVATIAPAATTTNNVVTYPVQVTFTPGDVPIKVGMSVTADIQVDHADDALLVPSRAITTQGNTRTVTVMQNGRAVRVPVVTGLTSNGQTQIVSSGGNGVAALKAGDTLRIASTTATSATTSTRNTSRNVFISGGPPGP